MKATSVILLFLFDHSFSSKISSKDYKLELLQVLNRHGDRTADREEMYKTDPYAEFFKNYGYGQLTPRGMEHIYETGVFLRERYDDFLGDYKYDEVYAYSSYADRTKMSLQLILAGLYPSSRNIVWNKDIHWTPIPTFYQPPESNILTTYHGCARYSKLVEKVEKSPKARKAMEKYRNFTEYVKNKTEIADTLPSTITSLFNNIEAVLGLRFPLPDWCSKADFAKLKEIASIYLDLGVETNLMKRITVGPMLREFLKNIADHERKRKKIKLYVYSGHDVDIGWLERTHNFTNVPIMPGYASAIIIEKLRGPDDRTYIRMFLWTGDQDRLIPLKLNDCDLECPLSDYLDFARHLLPDREVKKCFPDVTCVQKHE